VSARADVTVLLLAGGAGRRFGADKRLATVGGEPLVARAYRAAAEAGGEIWVLAGSAASAAALAAVLPQATMRLDPRPGEGPLAAFAAALGAIRTPLALLVAADMDRLDPELLAALAAEAHRCGAAAVPLSGGVPQVTCAAYPRRLAPAAEKAVAAGERSLSAWVGRRGASAGGDVVYVPPERWAGWTAASEPFHNINLPSDLPQGRHE
jgi:molybdopterin-guanine dinucleotide biosynthesis protein A